MLDLIKEMKIKELKDSIKENEKGLKDAQHEIDKIKYFVLLLKEELEIRK